MKTKCLWAVFLIAMTLPMEAQPVSREEALENARAFMEPKGCKFQQELEQARRRAGDQPLPYYIFHADGQKGFAIVSGEESAPAIIGYSETGTIDEANMPPALQAWLERYARQVTYVQKNGITLNNSAPANLGSPITTVSAKYDQSYPYNIDCPQVEAFSDEKCTVPYVKDGKTVEKTVSAVGCMATALAILMRHHKYPQSTTAEIPARMNHSYRTADNSTVIYERFDDPAIPVTTFDWDNILDDYTLRDGDGEIVPDDYGQPQTTGTDAQKKAVAHLMRVVASAIGMQYGNPELGGSSTNGAAMMDGAKKYLHFPNVELHMERSYASSEQFNQAVYDELKASGLVFFSGVSSNAGHSFIIDGYSSEDFFSVNWGWGGMCNGNYRMSNLEPLYEGQKLDNSGGFNNDLEFYSGLCPDSGTGISSVRRNPDSNGQQKSYDLQGREVDSGYRGIVIRNHRLVIN